MSDNTDAAPSVIHRLAKLREPFPEHLISKLPKPTKAQTDEVKQDYKKGIRCTVCGGWHHPKVVHLDYVGHATLTDRLLDVDPSWTWEPLAMDENGLPRFDAIGGLWIRLTVCGRSMLGYGHPDDKTGGNAIKEAIGDALRNSAMRMGAALNLWSKADLHKDDDNEEKKPSHKILPNDGVKEAVIEAGREPSLKLVAEKVEELVATTGIEGVALGYDMIKTNCKSIEEKIYVADLLAPLTRGAIKAYQEETNKRSHDAKVRTQGIEAAKAAVK